MTRPLIIDSFAGGGGASEGIRAALGRDPDYALNHDDKALAMHRINHPDTHHIEEDVWNVDAVGLCAGRDVGLLWMSPDCFPAGTLVLTRSGYRPIEEIGVGDEVLTHKNRWRRVTETSQNYRPLVTLKGHGHPGLTLSIEHPVYARRRDDVWSTEKPRGYRRILQEADWVPASALDRGWYWASPHHFPAADIPSVGGRGFCLDARLMWLVGRYLGDGWTRCTEDRAEIVLTCGRREVESLRRHLSVWPREGDRCTNAGELTWHERETTTAYQFTANHRGLVVWLREHFGHRAEAKGLPGWVLGLPRFLRSELLAGYVSADGWSDAGFTETRTVSAALAFSMKALVASLGHVATVHRGRNSAVIEGRHVEARPIYLLRWRHEPSEAHAQVVCDEDHVWAPIRDQTDDGAAARVFNIGVEEDESYVVEGIVVHNCKHFSKAKGGKPREKAIRGLAWVGVRWIKSLPKRQRPRVVFLENVEEFQDWGPLLDDGKPCPLQRGATFRSFVKAFEAMGYAVEWRELRACDYGAPTIRKRLFLVARCDGRPIVWPEATHGAPDSDGVRTGRLLPWRTAAEIIDWSLPCPSIFETKAEIWAKHHIRAQRPLKPNTMARLAKGTMRYVVKATRPFLVSVNHGDSRGRREYPLDEPVGTMTASRGEALVTPFVTFGQQGGGNRGATDLLHTICASPKDQNAIVAPVLVTNTTGHAASSASDPLATVTTGGHHMLASGFLVPRYGERPGQDPRARSVEEPAPVIVPTGNEGSLAAVHMTRQFGASVGSGAEEPAGTITAGGAGKAGVVAAFLAQHNTARGGEVNPGNDARAPMSTITAAGGHQNVVAAHLLNLRGSDRRDAPVDHPAPTATGGGNHAAAVYAFLAKYYGEGLPSQAADEPLHTVTAKPRHGVVTVLVQGQPYAIVDIGMRMLTPRERFNAQGFRPDYVIDHGEREDGTTFPLTLEQQGRMCGNSVCPQMAEALVAANYREEVARRPAREVAPMPLFAAE